MMRWLLLFLPALLAASNILSYNLYEREDRIDLMLTFDTPFEGALRQNVQNDAVVIKLGDTGIDAPKVKNVTSALLSKLTITPIGGEVQIIAKVAPGVDVQASKTTDAYGLRLRFFKTAAAAPAAAQENGTAFSALPTKPDGELTQSYYVVIAILVIGIIIMLLLKRKVSQGVANTAPAAGKKGRKTPKPAAAKKSWIFSKIGGERQETKDAVTVSYEKALDPYNRVVMLEHGQERYLVIVGNSNLLLEKFHDGQPVNEQDFERMLQEKHQELDSFLQLGNENEPLQNYKQKASGIDFDDLNRY